MYFIGVTTSQSAIMRIFPAWARLLHLGDCEIRGIDFVPHDEPHRYRDAVAFIKANPLALGALVTTHKIDLLAACRDQFDRLDEYAELMGEISCISKRDGQLIGSAKDPITAGLALEHFLPRRHWESSGASVLVLGAGGSARAITWYLMKPEHGENRPRKIIVVNRSQRRLVEMQNLHHRLGLSAGVEYHHVHGPEEADKLVSSLPPGSLVINATGLGKDAPGSPLTDSVAFPERGFIWDFNYRGDLGFLRQARAQQQQRCLAIEDGWAYFIYGWTSVMAEVFAIDIPTAGPLFEELSSVARSLK